MYGRAALTPPPPCCPSHPASLPHFPLGRPPLLYIHPPRSTPPGPPTSPPSPCGRALNRPRRCSIGWTPNPSQQDHSPPHALPGSDLPRPAQSLPPPNAPPPGGSRPQGLSPRDTPCITVIPFGYTQTAAHIAVIVIAHAYRLPLVGTWKSTQGPPQLHYPLLRPPLLRLFPLANNKPWNSPPCLWLWQDNSFQPIDPVLCGGRISSWTPR